MAGQYLRTPDQVCFGSMSNTRKSKFVRRPRSGADISALREMADAINSLLNGSMTEGGEIHFADGNVVWDLPPQVTQNLFYPFKIFQPTNISAFIGQTVPLVVASNGTNCPLQTCTITDAQTPTNLEAVPPAISVADAWRFWAIRAGYVEVRRNYIPGAPFAVPPFADNFAMLLVPQQCDYTGMAQVDGQSDLFYPPDETYTTAENIIVLGGTPNDGVLTALLWMEVLPDISSAAAPTVVIRGYINADLEINTTEFSSYNNGVIPIGKILAGQPDDVLQSQLYSKNYIFDHARNRYPCGNGNFGGNGAGTVLNVRGSAKIDTDTDTGTTVPVDLISQIFYPGDAIWFYDYDSEEVNYFNIYIFTGAIPALLTPFSGATNIPNLPDDGNWTAWSPISLSPNP
jgi:hypothetical protein